MISLWTPEYNFDILVCRHADYNPEDNQLTLVGEQQIETLADSVADLFNGRQAFMAYSPAKRAKNSTNKLIAHLGGWIDSEKVNWLYVRSSPDIGAILSYIETQKTKALDILAFMTHAEVAMPLVESLSPDWTVHPIEKGQAIYIPKGGWEPVLYPR